MLEASQVRFVSGLYMHTCMYPHEHTHTHTLKCVVFSLNLETSKGREGSP